jgi:REP element-mobilizing transposase RayT
MYMTHTNMELHDNHMHYLLSIPIDEDNVTNVLKTTTWSINVPYIKQIQHYNEMIYKTRQ